VVTHQGQPRSTITASGFTNLPPGRRIHARLEPPDEGVYGDPSDGYGHRTIFFRDPERNVLEIYADIEPRLDGE